MIAPDVVLTAGHCLPTHLNSVKPHVGTYSFLSGDTKTHETFQIVNMTRHGHWQRLGEDEFRHDLALLFLDRPAHNHTYIKLNRNENLPTFVHEEGQVLTAMGVGWTSNDYRNAKKAMVLQEVNLEYLPNDECELFYDQDVDDDDEDEDGPSDYLGRIQHDHLCTTGGPENKRDAWYVFDEQCFMPQIDQMRCYYDVRSRKLLTLHFPHHFYCDSTAPLTVAAPLSSREKMLDRMSLLPWYRGVKDAPIPTFQASTLVSQMDLILSTKAFVKCHHTLPPNSAVLALKPHPQSSKKPIHLDELEPV